MSKTYKDKANHFVHHGDAPADHSVGKKVELMIKKLSLNGAGLRHGNKRNQVAALKVASRKGVRAKLHQMLLSDLASDDLDLSAV